MGNTTTSKEKKTKFYVDGIPSDPGFHLDVRNSHGKWCRVQIIYHKKVSEKLSTKLLQQYPCNLSNIDKYHKKDGLYVSYDGFSDNWNEWVFDLSQRKVSKPGSKSKLSTELPKMSYLMECESILQQIMTTCNDNAVSITEDSKFRQNEHSKLKSQLLQIMNNKWTAEELVKLWALNPVDSLLKKGQYDYLKSVITAITDKSNNNEEKDDSNADLFNGEQRVCITCTECKQYSITTENFNSLQLSLPDAAKEELSISVNIHHNSMHHYANEQYNDYFITTKPIRTVYKMPNLTIRHLAHQIARDYASNTDDITICKYNFEAELSTLSQNEVEVYLCKDIESKSDHDSLMYTFAISIKKSKISIDTFLLRLPIYSTCQDLYKYVYRHFVLLFAETEYENILRMPKYKYYQNIIIDGYIRNNIDEQLNVAPTELSQMIQLFCGDMVCWHFYVLKSCNNNNMNLIWNEILDSEKRGFDISIFRSISNHSKYGDPLQHFEETVIPCSDEIQLKQLRGKMEIHLSTNRQMTNDVIIDCKEGFLPKVKVANPIHSVSTKEYQIWKRNETHFNNDNDIINIELKQYLDQYRYYKNHVWKCSNCDRMKIGVRKIEFVSLPKIMILYLDKSQDNHLVYEEIMVIRDLKFKLSASVDANNCGAIVLIYKCD